MYLTLVQIAESFGVTEKTVEDWLRREQLPHTDDRGRILFDRAQVAQWAATRGLTAQAGFLAPESSVFSTGVRLESLLRAGGIWRDVEPGDLLSILAKVVESIPGVTAPVCKLMVQRLRAKDGLTLAPVGGGMALPHPSVHVALGREAGTVALLFLKAPLPLEKPPADGVPITRLIFFIAPSPRAHLDLLGRLSRVLSKGALGALLAREAPSEEILQAVAAADATLAAHGGQHPGS